MNLWKRVASQTILFPKGKQLEKDYVVSVQNDLQFREKGCILHGSTDF